MQGFAIAYAAGTAWAMLSAALPALPSGLSCALAGLWLLSRGARWRVPAGLLLGAGWAMVYIVWHEPPRLLALTTPQDAVIEGVIDSMPQRGAGTRFFLHTDRIRLGDAEWRGSLRVRLSWRRAPDLLPGQRWRIAVRLRPVSGFRNPGSSDYVGWLYRQGVRYTGYVRADGGEMLGADTCCLMLRWRHALARRLDSLRLAPRGAGIISAMTLGERNGLDVPTRDLFARAGISHLVAISGLHIGLVAGLAMWLGSGIWRRIPPWCLRVPAPLAAASVGVTAGLAYGLLAGMALPTQRAVIMLLVAWLALLLRRTSRPGSVLASALIAVLIWDPYAVLDAGLWLSFVAVAAILLANRWTRGRGVVVRALSIQGAISLALLPVLWLFDLGGSLLGLPLNLLLVPLFGFVVVPASLLGLALLALGIDGHGMLLGWLASALEFLVQMLAALIAAWPDSYLQSSWELAVIGLGAVAMALLLVPPGVPGRRLGLLALAALVLPRAPDLAPGQMRLSALDVGQGLAVVLETRTHLLVYDTGPGYASGFNTADAVLLPFLRRAGRSVVDVLMLSNADQDHAGAAPALLTGIEVSRVLSGEPGELPIPASACVQGQSWVWDDVRFEILHPVPDTELQGNDASCVLRVQAGAHSVLLTGDIGVKVERGLVADGAIGRQTIVFAAHHGSNSSSAPEFVTATQPDYVLYSVGRHNRWRFPRDPVSARWREIGATTLRTDRDGAITFILGGEGGPSPPTRYAQDARRHWHD